jgi:hypothetical protein
VCRDNYALVGDPSTNWTTAVNVADSVNGCLCSQAEEDAGSCAQPPGIEKLTHTVLRLKLNFSALFECPKSLSCSSGRTSIDLAARTAQAYAPLYSSHPRLPPNSTVVQRLDVRLTTGFCAFCVAANGDSSIASTTKIYAWSSVS